MLKSELIFVHEYLTECFEYLPSGILMWKHRPRYHFKDNASSIRWNAVHAGTQADSLVSLVPSITIDGKKRRADSLIWLYHNPTNNEEPTIPNISHQHYDPVDNRIECLSPGKTPRVKYDHSPSNSIVYTWKSLTSRWQICALSSHDVPRIIYTFQFVHLKIDAQRITKHLNSIFR